MDSVVFLVQEKTEDWFEMIKEDEKWRDVCDNVEKDGRTLHEKSIFGFKSGCLVKIESFGRERKVVLVEKRKALWEEVHCGQLGGHFGAKN
uniref:Uncharacterized protein n=1 Tax=Panagrolaimus superbus TaxID=310955 RepID=A0A914Z8J2_9BILA